MKRAWLEISAIGAALTALALLPSGCGTAGDGGRVLVIGLDGATWDLLDPWIEAGDLPNLAAFREESAWGDLMSVRPYLSPPAWTSAVTAVNPGRHGIFDFQRRIPGPVMNVIQETSASRAATPLWTMLKGHGLRSAYVNIPMTDPPDEVDGVMISGFPHVDKGGWTYPRRLQDEFPDYILDAMEMNVPEGKEDSVLTEIHSVLEARWRLVKDLYAREPWDLFWAVFTQTDRIQHTFWGYMDPPDPRIGAERAAPYRNAVHDLWVRVDEILGEFLGMVDPGTTVVLMSDHGFGAIRRELRVLPYVRRQTASQVLRERASEVYTLDPSDATRLYVRVQGRDPGAVLDAKEQGETLDELKRVLETAVDDTMGRRVVEGVWPREEIYRGAMARKGPDLTALAADGYFLVKGDPEGEGPAIGPVGMNLSGWHRMNGLYAIRGDHVVPGRRDAQGTRPYNLMDVTPTLLYLLDQRVPAGLDGKVMTGILDPGFVSGQPVRQGPPLPELTEDDLPDSVDVEGLQNLPYIGG